MTNEELQYLITTLKSDEYDYTHIMQVCDAIRELLELRQFIDKAFIAHPNLDIDIINCTVDQTKAAWDNYFGVNKD